MYVEFYGLSKEPFGSINSRHIYLSASQRKALTELHYGLEDGHRVQLLLADSGLGKTILLLALEARLKTYTHAFHFSSIDSTSRKALMRIVSDLTSEMPVNRHNGQTEQIDSVPVSGNEVSRPTVLLIDDAQALSNAELEGISLLSRPNLVNSDQVRVVFAGHLDLLDRLKRLNPRNSFKDIRLTPLETDEAEEYVRHRLRLVTGVRDPIFTPAAVNGIARQSRGLPKSIDNLCVSALTAGAKYQLKQIDTSVLDTNHAEASGQPISQEVESPDIERPSTTAPFQSRSRRAVLLMTLALVIVATSLLYERTHMRPMVKIAVKGNAPSSKASLAEVDQSVALIRTGIGKTGMQGSGSIESSKTITPSSSEGSSSVKSSIAHGSLLFTAEPANSETPRLTPQVRNPAAASIPTPAFASVVTPTTLLQKAPSAKAEPAVMQDNPLREQSRTSTTSRDTLTTLDTRRTRARVEAGDDYMRRGEYEKAITSYEEALALSPGNDQIQRNIERARRAKTAEAQILSPSSP